MDSMVLDERRTNLLMNEAYRRGSEYLPRWRACAPAAFAAIMDTLGYDDDPVILEIWKSSVGLSGGTGFMTVGTCGAVASAALAISLSFAYGKQDIEDMNKMFNVNLAVAELGDRINRRLGSIQCQEIQLAMWGKAYRLTHFDSLNEFCRMSVTEAGQPRCQEVVGSIARLAVEKIIALNPGFVREK